ncbi:serine O-acetyltransferase [Granulicoccus sp. GXG6511]|uniref:serine O-acetyltransferase n=1 Tax=Granulicoccus sp. GXG6511 TaxID=3381351 RepID=UPI003D7C9FD3
MPRVDQQRAGRTPWKATSGDPVTHDTPPRIPAERWWVEKLARRYPIVDIIREDRQTNGGFSQPGCQAVLFHRLANWAESGNAPWALRGPVRTLAKWGGRVSRMVYGIELPAEVTLGRRVRIAHQSGIVIHPDAVIDDDVLIRQNVTIGLRGDNDEGEPHAVPHIHRGVSLGAGAVVVGPIDIGPAATVGANAVVTADVPAGGKAVAPRSRIHAPARRGPEFRVVSG